MKRVAIGLAGLFVVVLAIAVGKQLSTDAMAVVVGVVCGIGASIPTSLLMLFLLRGREQQDPQQKPFPQIPAVMIVNPPNVSGNPYPQPWAGQYLPSPASGAPRQFEVLGSDEYGS